MKIKTLKYVLLFALCPILFSGCRVQQPTIEEVGHYSINPNADLYSIQSLSIAEIQNNTNYADVALPMSKILYNTLIKKHLFELEFIDADTADWNQVCNSEGLADKATLKRYKEMLGTDALMVGSLTQYKPFPSLLIGLKLKIYDLRTGQIVWTLEQVWDSSDKGVENRIKRYFDNNMKSGLDPMNWEFVRTSPNAYRQFVCFEVSSTLPTRNYYMTEYVNHEQSPAGTRDQVLRPIIRFPGRAKEVIGLK